MALRVLLDLPAGSRSVAVEIDAGRTVAELRDALLEHLGTPARLDGQAPLLASARMGWLDPGLSLRQAGLRNGDRLTVAAAGAPSPEPAADGRPVVEVQVAGGPCAGCRIALPPGTFRVGRSPACDIVVDDPTVSAVHLEIEVDASGRVSTRDVGATNVTRVDGAPVLEPVSPGPGQVVELGATPVSFAQPAPVPSARPPDSSFHVPYNRPPRFMPQPHRLAFELDAPPAPVGRQRLPLMSALAPLALGAVTWAVTRQPLMLLFAAMSPVMAAGSLLESLVGDRRGRRRAAATFRQRLDTVAGEMGRAVREEERRQRAATPDLATLVRRAEALDGSLWERRPQDEDFLELRVGSGDRPSGVELRLGPGGDPALREQAERLRERHTMLTAVPLTLPLLRVGSVGLTGDPDRLDALARALVLQAVTLHSPEELVVAAAVPDLAGDAWGWLSWLPHVLTERSRLGLPLVVDAARAGGLVQRLTSLLVTRRQAASPAGEPAVLALLHAGVGAAPGAVAPLLAEGPRHRIFVIWVGGRSREELPGELGAVIQVERAVPALRLILPASGDKDECLSADGCLADVALGAALALSGVRDAGGSGERANVPARAGLLEVLGIEGRPQLIEEWWRRDDPLLRAPLGIGPGGAVFELSLRNDGPHALVGGMTGAGKSELLQTLVVSLAARHSPRHLTFLLIDYKGGAAFKDFVDLPHEVGLVTDLDGHLVNRALVSLRAELRRREEVLRQAGTKDLAALQSRRPDLAPPSLVIVVDEVAALAAELPEFIDGMVAIAQQGRSLGIHLVLATQRPAGVINDKIRANTNLRISLRFSDEAESRDIVGTAAAAAPGLPQGRAFARIATGRVLEFQTAYAGGRTRRMARPVHPLVRDVGNAWAAHDGSDTDGAAETGAPGIAESDLVELVRLLRETNHRLGVPPPPRPWLPTLPEVLPLTRLPPPGGTGPRAVLGLVDDPTRQSQVPLEFGLEEDGSLLVYGTAAAGKTTLLRTLAMSAAAGHGPRDLHLYGLDFATRGLLALQALPHCGGVITGDEPERLARLLSMLRGEVERRRELLATTGASSLGEHRAARPDDAAPPYVLVLLDGYPGFASVSQEFDQGAGIAVLRTLVADGRAVGISFVIASDRQAPFLSALSAGMSRRVILRMATDEEYGALGLSRAAYRDVILPPGRGFTEKGLEVQCACPGDNPAGGAQAAALAAAGTELRRRHGAGDVPAVRLLPARVHRESLPVPASPLEAVIGLEDRTLGPVRLDLAEGHFVIAGPRRSGRTTALETIALSLARLGLVELHLLADRRTSPLARLDVWDSVALGAEACVEAGRRLAAERRQAEPGATVRSCVVVVDDGENLTDTMANRDGLDWLAQRGPEHGVRIVAAVEVQAAQRALSLSWLGLVLRERQGLLLDPTDGMLLGVRLPPARPSSRTVGRGYLVQQGLWELVQVAGP